MGIPAFESVPVGQRVLLGLVQAVAVRFGGFQSIAISVPAPAEQRVVTWMFEDVMVAR